MAYYSLLTGRIPERLSFDYIHNIYIRAPAICSSSAPVISSSDIIVNLPEILRRVGRVAGLLVGEELLFY